MSRQTHVVLLDYLQRAKEENLTSVEFTNPSLLAWNQTEWDSLSNMLASHKPLSRAKKGALTTQNIEQLPTILMSCEVSANPTEVSKSIDSRKLRPKYLHKQLVGLSNSEIQRLKVTLQSNDKYISEFNLSSFGSVALKPAPAEKDESSLLPGDEAAKQGIGENSPKLERMTESSEETSSPQTTPEAGNPITQQSDVTNGDGKNSTNVAVNVTSEQNIALVGKLDELSSAPVPPKEEILFSLDKVKEHIVEQTRFLLFEVEHSQTSNKSSPRIDYIAPWNILVLISLPVEVFAQDLQKEITVIEKYLHSPNWSGEPQKEYAELCKKLSSLGSEGIHYTQDWFYNSSVEMPGIIQELEQDDSADELQQDGGNKKDQNKQAARAPINMDSEMMQEASPEPVLQQEQSIKNKKPKKPKVKTEILTTEWSDNFFTDLQENPTILQVASRFSHFFCNIKDPNMNWQVLLEGETQNKPTGKNKKAKKNRQAIQNGDTGTVSRRPATGEEIQTELERVFYAYFTDENEQKLGPDAKLRRFKYHGPEDVLSFHQLPKEVVDYLCFNQRIRHLVNTNIGWSNLLGACSFKVRFDSEASPQIVLAPNTAFSNYLALLDGTDIKKALKVWTQSVQYLLGDKTVGGDSGKKDKALLSPEAALKLLGLLFSIVESAPNSKSLFGEQKDQQTTFSELLDNLLRDILKKDEEFGENFYMKMLECVWSNKHEMVRSYLYCRPLSTVEEGKNHPLRSLIGISMLERIINDAELSVPTARIVLQQHLQTLKHSESVVAFLISLLGSKTPFIETTFKVIHETWKFNLNWNRVDSVENLLTKKILSNPQLTDLLLGIHHFVTAAERETPEAYAANKKAILQDNNEFYGLYKLLTVRLPEVLLKMELPVHLLVAEGPLNPSIVDGLLAKLNSDLPAMLKENRNKINEISDSLKLHLNRIDTYLLLPQTRLMEVDYLTNSKKILLKLVETFSQQPLCSLVADENRKRLKILEEQIWQDLPHFYRFAPTASEIFDVVRNSKNLQDLKSNLEIYIQESTNKFASFTNPQRFTRELWLKYLPNANLRTMERDNNQFGEAYYTDFLSGLRLPNHKQSTIEIIQNAKRFSAVRWCVENSSGCNSFAETQSGLGKLVQMRTGRALDIIKKIAAKFATLTDNQAFLGAAFEIDPYLQVLDDITYQNGTNLVSVVSKSARVLSFIKKQKKEEIRAMRDDCDASQTELVNNLDFMNIHLRFIVETPEGLDTDALMKRLSALDWKIQAKLINCIPHLESHAEHLVYIFEKAKKSANFAKQQVEMMNQSCQLRIKYSPLSEKFEIEAKLNSVKGAKEEVISPLELLELFNQIRIINITISSSLSMETEEDSRNKNFPVFIQLADELDHLLKSIYRLREIGMMDEKFNNTILATLVGKQNQAMFQLEAAQSTLLIEYCARDIEKLTEANKGLKAKTVQLHDCFIKEYSDWSLLTFYHGKRLFYLTEYFSGKLTDQLKRELVINQMYESIEVPELEQMIMRNENQTGLSETDLVSRLETVSRLMKNKTEQAMQGLSIHKVDSKDSVYKDFRKTVKLISKAKLSQYEWILRWLCLAEKNTQNFLRLSQLLFCHEQTDQYELTAFLQRALLDPSHREYFILNIDTLKQSSLREFKQLVTGIHSSQKGKFNSKLFVFTNQERVIEELKFDSSAFEVLDATLAKDVDNVATTQLTSEQYYKSIFGRTQVVLSGMAGMGKSSFIKDDSRDCQHVEVFLAGEISNNIIMLRMSECISQLNISAPIALVIKLEHMDRFEELVSLIDSTLFQICFLGRISSDTGCFKFKSNIKKVYIEVGNTMRDQFMLLSKVLKLFKESHTKDNPLLVQIKPFNIERIKLDPGAHSREQLALSLLYKIEQETIGSQAASQGGQLPEKEMRRIISNHFLYPASNRGKGEQVTYSQYNFWIDTLAYYAQCLDTCKVVSYQTTPQAKRLRNELAEEILLLSDQICGFTVEQAKTSQTGMLELSSKNALNDTSFNYNAQMEALKLRTQSLQKWDSSKMLIPLMSQNSLILLKSAEKLLENRQDSYRYNRRNQTRDYLDNQGWYKEILEAGQKVGKDIQYLRMMAHYLEFEGHQLIERTNLFRTKGFVITSDNLMKMGLILLKSKFEAPIVLMGESGCGKSYLSEFVAVALLQDEIEILTLYSGLTIVELLEFVRKCVDKAKKIAGQGKKLWIFFDEFNTSALQSVVGEIMIDRCCSVGSEEIRQIPPNIVFIAACNPYRLKVKQNNIGLVPKTEDTMLSHRVFPIPERILNFIWDFGQLSDEDERKYAANIIAKANLFADVPERDRKMYQEKLATVTYNCHRMIKRTDELSAMSLRDLNRVTKTYAWFRKIYQFIDSSGIERISDQNNRVQSTICSLMLCYGLRLNGQKARQTQFLTELCTNLKEIAPFSNKKPDDILNTLSDFVEKYLFTELRGLTGMPPIIPEDVAPNRPLKENFIAMLVGFDTLLPVIICGSPGTSKTLCTQILSLALTPEVISHRNSRIFKRFKPMFSIYYGGSQTSTAEGVKLVFERGRKYLSNNPTSADTPTVLFDEIGLAELSPHNPLKVLHPLLENQDRKGNEIAFIGLSNWTLDLSKMNRLIYVARADLELKDLEAIFENSISKLQSSPPDRAYFSSVLKVLAQSYFDYRSWQTAKDTHIAHKNFHGSRDIYAVAKFIYRKVAEKQKITPAIILQWIKEAIERNFSGDFYPFAMVGWTPTKSVPGLDDEPRLPALERIKFSDLKSVNAINELCAERRGSNEPDTFLTSAGVFKRFFLKNSKEKIDKKSFLAEDHTMNLIDQNLLDRNCRFLMLKSESDLVDTMLVEKLKKMVQSKPELHCYLINKEAQGHDRSNCKIIDWRGVENQENSLELLSTLKTYISEGYIVVMKNLDGLYGSLYDLFNQKYTVVEDQKSCFLYYGESKQKVNVHDLFKCIVILPAYTDPKNSKVDIELKQPAPFLNRFEKFYVRIASLLTQSAVRRLLALHRAAMQCANNPKVSFVGLSSELLTSISVRLEDISNVQHGVAAVELPNQGSQRIPDEQMIKILQMSTNQILTDSRSTNRQKLAEVVDHMQLSGEDDSEFSKEEIALLLKAHPFHSLLDIAKYCEQQLVAQWAVFTFSSTEAFEGQVKLIHDHTSSREQEYQWKTIDFEELAAVGVEGRNLKLKSFSGNLLIHVPTVSLEHFEILNQIKTAIAENSSVNAIIMVIQLDRDMNKFQGITAAGCIDFWNSWENIVMDDLEYNNYEEMHHVLQCPPLDLIAIETNPFVDVSENKFGTRILETTIVNAAHAFSARFEDEGLLDCKEHIADFFIKNESLISRIKGELNLRIPKINKIFGLESCKTFLAKNPRAQQQPQNQVKNLEAELVLLLSSILKKILDELLTDLNNHLANIFAYAKGVNSPTKALSDMFKQSLDAKIASWNPSGPVSDMQVIHMEHPVLRDDPEFIQVSNKLRKYLSLSKGSSQQSECAELMIKCKTDELSLLNEQHVESIDERSETVERGQEHIFDKYFKDFEESHATFEEYFAGKSIKFTSPEVYEAFVFDLIRSASSAEDLELAHLRSLNKFRPFFRFLQGCFGKGQDEKNLSNLLFGYVYLAVGFLDSLKDLSKIAQTRRVTLEEFLETEGETKLTDRLEIQKAHFLKKLRMQGSKLHEQTFRAELRYTSEISKTQLYEKLRFSLNQGSQSIGLASLLILKAIQELTIDETTRGEMNKLQTLKGDLGEKAYIHRVKTDLPKFLQKIQCKQNMQEFQQFMNILCEYGFMCGLEYDLSFFVSEQSSELFESLTSQQMEFYCNSLISGVMEAESRAFTQLFNSASNVNQIRTAVKKDFRLQRLSRCMEEIRAGKSGRFEVFQIMFGDRVVLERQKRTRECGLGEDTFNTLNVVLSQVNNDKETSTLVTLVLVGVMRSLFTSEYFQEHAKLQAEEFTWVQQMGQQPLKVLELPQQMLSTEAHLFKTFFLQAVHLYGQPEQLRKYYPILDSYIKQQEGLKSGSQRLSFLSEDLIQLYNKLHTQSFALLLKIDTNQEQLLQLINLVNASKINRYVFSILMINYFVLESKSGQLAAYSEPYLELIGALKLPENLTQMLQLVVKGDEFDFREFLQESQDNTAENLKRLFYQQLAIRVCFQDSPSPAVTRDDKGKLHVANTDHFATVVSDPRVDNLCSVLTQVTTYRLRELRWSPTGPMPQPSNHPRVGMYRCSCGFAYGLSDCGYPNGIMNCSQCRQQIGGNYPHMVARPGHIHIETFDQAEQFIFQDYGNVAGRYHAHRIMDIHDASLIPLKLREVGIEQFVRHYQDENYLSILGQRMIFNHLFDHMGLITKEPMLSEADKVLYETALETVVDFRRPEINTMANRRIDSPLKYILAHIKNDIEVLKKHLRLRNSLDACNWVSGVLSYYAESQLVKEATTSKPKIPQEWITTPQGLLNLQSEMNNKMKKEDLADPFVMYRSLVNCQINSRGLKIMCKEFGAHPNVEYLFKMMRHNYTDLDQLRLTFHEMAQNRSPFLHSMITYSELLRDLPKIVGTIWALVKTIYRRYNNELDFNAAGRMTIAETKDDEIRDLFRAFVEMWEPKSFLRNHIDQFNEVFTFAFMCQQDLNVMEWIERIMQNGENTTLLNFIITSEKDYQDRQLLYIKSLLRTIIENVHNKLVRAANKLLLRESEDSEAKNLLDLQKEDLLEPVEMDQLILRHMWFSTEALKETSTVFDLQRVELAVAKLAKRPVFLLDEHDLPHFEFKNSSSKAGQMQKSLEQLFRHVKGVQVTAEVVEELGKKELHELEEFDTFLLVLAHEVYNKNKFSKGNAKLATLMRQLLTEHNAVLKEAKFKELQLRELKSLFEATKAQILAVQLRAKQNAPLSSEMVASLREVSVEHLEQLRREMRETLQDYPAEYLSKLLEEEIHGYVDSELSVKCPQWVVLHKLKFRDIAHLDQEFQSRNSD